MGESNGKKSTQYKNKYNSANYDSLRIVVPKGRKATVEALAAERGESVNGLVNSLLRVAAGLTEEQWKETTKERE